MAMGQMGEFMKRVHGDGKRHGGMGERDYLAGLGASPGSNISQNGDSAIFLAGLGASPGSNLQQELGLIKPKQTLRDRPRIWIPL
jgi:hypothetical protein